MNINELPRKSRGAKIKPPKPWQVRSEAYKVFLEEYGRPSDNVRLKLKKKWIVLNSIHNVVKATRILDAMKKISE